MNKASQILKKLSIIIAAGVGIYAVIVVLGIYFHAQVDKQDPNHTKLSKTLEEHYGQAEYKKLDLSKPILDQTRTIKMAGRTFDIPIVFIQGPLSEGLEQDGVNLLYVLPDYTHRADFKDKQEYYKARDDRRFGHMLIQREGKEAPFETKISNRRKRLSKEEPIGEADQLSGLEGHKWYHWDQGIHRQWSDVYLEKDATGSTFSIIECSVKARGGHIKFPGCKHKFIDKGIVYGIYYNRDKYLFQWQDQRRKAVKFIDRFEQQ